LPISLLSSAKKGNDPVLGASPLKRFLQRHLKTRLARSLIAGEVTEDSQVKFTVKDDGLVMK
jgi:ATP-dependent Clp protease ATP-binding subunit ClpB